MRRSLVITLAATIGSVALAVACSSREAVGVRRGVLETRPTDAIEASPTVPAPAEPTPIAGISPAAAPAIATSLQARSDQPLPQTLPGEMLIRQGTASVQVDSLDAGIAGIRGLARRVGAVVANTSMQQGQDQLRSASVELRIPSARFDDAVAALSPLGKVESVNVSVEDVGEEFVDVSARVANARRLEQRLVELLAQRTGKLGDVLQVERELARVREEIERYEGRLRYLQTRSSVSTLTVTVHERPPFVADRPGTHPIRDAVAQAGKNFVAFTAACIAALGVLLPVGGLIALAYFTVARRLLGARASTRSG